MLVKITTAGPRQVVKLVESYRDIGRMPRQRVIATLRRIEAVRCGEADSLLNVEVLRKHELSLRKIAAEMGCAVNTMRNHLAQGSQARYQRQKKWVTKLSAHATYLR